MKERSLRELVGDDVPEAELERLRAAHDALSSSPPPPVASESLTSRVRQIPHAEASRGGRGRRALAGLAAAAAIAGVAFGLGWWASGGDDGLPVAEVIELEPTAAAPEGAWMRIDVLPVDDAGNWPMAADAGGLEPLPPGGYYELWLTRDGKRASSCGRFAVDETGQARDVWLNAPYAFEEYDRWIVVAIRPGQKPSPELFDGPVHATPS